jgi:hypothetical protein
MQLLEGIEMANKSKQTAEREDAANGFALDFSGPPISSDRSRGASGSRPPQTRGLSLENK